MEELTERSASEMLSRLGWQNYMLMPLTGGANNRVFRVETAEKKAVLKIYFQHPNDARDRLRSEYDFASFAWGKGLRTLPQPLAIDKERGLALYGFIEGKPFESQDVTAAAVAKAAQFFSDLNKHKSSPEAKRLSTASEAYFSVAEHMIGINGRVSALENIAEESDVDREARAFVTNDLLPVWNEVRAGLGGFKSDVADSDKCLSPSDFGFHNAIGASDGKVSFVDFEYAGWDDPAKTIGDFFCQPKIPVSMEFYDAFARGVAASTNTPDKMLERANRLLPAYQAKWCCILLNEFLPTNQKRRRFAGGAEDLQQRKAGQLQKAREALARLTRQGAKR